MIGIKKWLVHDIRGLTSFFIAATKQGLITRNRLTNIFYLTNGLMEHEAKDLSFT